MRGDTVQQCMFQHVLQESLSPVHRTPLMWGGVCCVGVWWSHSTWGGGGLTGSVLPTFTTPQGGAYRQRAFDVEWGVLCVFAVWSSWAGHWCVCSPPPPHTHTRAPPVPQPKTGLHLTCHTRQLACRLRLIVTMASSLCNYH